MTGPDEAAAVWRDRTLVALDGLVADPPTELAVVEEVALHFADRFAPADRNYAVKSTSPRWHGHVRGALAGPAVRAADPGERPARRSPPRAAAPSPPRRRPTRRPSRGPGLRPPTEPTEPLLVAGVIAAPLRAPEAREQMGFSGEDDVPIPVMAEVNLQFAGGPRAAFARLDRLWERVSGGTPQHVADQYATGSLSMRQVERLVSADAAPVAWPLRSIHRVWPDFPVQLHVDASCVTVKADAARRSFNAFGSGIVWAVVDTGIDGTHPHFQGHHTLDDPQVKRAAPGLHRRGRPRLTDEAGHGTHVAGIIAGAVEPWFTEPPETAVPARHGEQAQPGEPAGADERAPHRRRPGPARRDGAAGPAGQPQGGAVAAGRPTTGSTG